MAGAGISVDSIAISRFMVRVSPSFILSAFRIWDFMGRRQVPLSGKMLVFQVEPPIVTFTGREPQPRVYMPKLSFMFSAVSFSILTKNQAPPLVELLCNSRAASETLLELRFLWNLLVSEVSSGLPVHLKILAFIL